MNDLVENCKIDGNVLLDGKDIFKGNGRDHTASSCWNGISAAKSISKSVYDNVAYNRELPESRKNLSWMRSLSEASSGSNLG